MPIKIFLSYSRKDSNLASAVARMLSRDYEVWWDLELRAGERFRDRIRGELEQAHCVVVLWTEHSVDSDWVLDEATLAKDRDALIPVCCAGVEPPIGHKSRHFLAFHSAEKPPTAKEFKLLTDSISNLLARALHSARTMPGALDARPSKEAGPERPKRLVGGLAGTFLAAAGVGAFHVSTQGANPFDPAPGEVHETREPSSEPRPTEADPGKAYVQSSTREASRLDASAAGTESASHQTATAPPPAQPEPAESKDPSAAAPPWDVLEDGCLEYSQRLWWVRGYSGTHSDGSAALAAAPTIPPGEPAWRMPRADELRELANLVQFEALAPLRGRLAWTADSAQGLNAFAVRLADEQVGPHKIPRKTLATFILIRERP